ncbi:MAG: tetratricopeptide repeat protein [Syntrophales bacterium]|nr:tetratricopeptide repeat protein [Syntrophales bacterium]
MANSNTKTLIVSIGAYALIIFFLYSCASTPSQLLSEGLSFHGQGQYDKAIAKYKEVIKDAPTLHTPDSDNRSVMGLLALSYANNTEADQAIKVAKQALEKDPNDWVALAALGIAQIFRRDFENAKQNLMHSISAKPGAWHAYIWLASIYLIEKNMEKAESTLEKSLDIYPKNPVARSRIAIIECMKGNQGAAIQEFKQTIYDMQILDVLAMSRYENYVEDLYLSLNSIFRGDIEIATLQLQKYVKKKPNKGANFLFGVIYSLKRDRKLAIEYFKKETEDKGPFCFLSNIELSALYAYDADITGFFKAESSIPRCFK